MTTTQHQKIKELVSKYNDILLNSMRLAVAEDFINLMLLNHDDKEFELKNLLENKNDFYNSILKEFMKQNSSSVLDDLKQMEDPTLGMKTLKKRPLTSTNSALAADRKQKQEYRTSNDSRDGS